MICNVWKSLDKKWIMLEKVVLKKTSRRIQICFQKSCRIVRKQKTSIFTPMCCRVVDGERESTRPITLKRIEYCNFNLEHLWVAITEVLYLQSCHRTLFGVSKNWALWCTNKCACAIIIIYFLGIQYKYTYNIIVYLLCYYRSLNINTMVDRPRIM